MQSNEQKKLQQQRRRCDVATLRSVEKNPDFQQMELPLELGKGEQVLMHTRLEAPSSKRCAWYELFLIKAANGFLIEKHSGASGCGRQKETWFRRHRIDAEKKFSKIVTDKINPARRSPRIYSVVTSEPAFSTKMIMEY